jgi:polyphosphate kinase 2
MALVGHACDTVEMNSAPDSSEHDLQKRLHRELLDSIDEEFEMEIEDRLHVGPGGAQSAVLPADDPAARRTYFRELFRLQGELVKVQDWVVATGCKIVVLFEGRDAAGKGSVIKRITQRLNPRVCRVAALPAPSEREKSQWYFQRYVAQLPAAGEMVLFDRSWYNRAGVERVMGFCDDAQYEEFFRSVPEFEKMLVRSGIKLIKYYLDISKAEQKLRLKERAQDPLTQWKLSPIDGAATKYWDDYSRARNEMLAATHNATAPWTIVLADDKRAARLNIIRDLLSRLSYRGKDKKLVTPDRDVVFDYNVSQVKRGLLAK